MPGHPLNPPTPWQGCMRVICPSCECPLEGADKFLGRTVRCAACQATFTVPTRGDNSDLAGQGITAVAPRVPSSWQPLPAPDGRTRRSCLFTDDDDDIPLEEIRPSRRPKPYANTGDAENKVRIPAIGLLIYSGLAIGLPFASFVFQWVTLANQVAGPPLRPAAPDLIFSAINVVIAVAYNGFIFWAAWQMKRLRHFGCAMAASIMTIIPCFGICCLAGIPLGIWALRVLSDTEVKEAFT